jgi:hypothetical protein
MATGKQAQGKRPTLTIAKSKDEKTPKSRVEEMFGGKAEIAGSDGSGPVMRVEATIPLPEHADAEVKSVKGIVDRIDAVFDSIGTSNLPDTEIPPAKDNMSTYATEFTVAQRLKKRAEKRYERAKKTAEEVGCFGDPEKYVSGETVEVYRSGAFTFSVQVNADSEVVDKDLVEEVLREVSPTKWRELMQRCKKPRKGATSYVVALR